MLVLTRKPDERILIGDSIEIVVIEVKGDQVRLGVKAPRSLPIYRKEVYEEIETENRRASEAIKTENTDSLKEFFEGLSPTDDE